MRSLSPRPGPINGGIHAREVLPQPHRTGHPHALSTSWTPLIHFYHGTSLANARQLLSIDIPVMDLALYFPLDYSEYTDFGKGFYTHPHESRHLAFEWAKAKHKDWGVVRFSFSRKALKTIPEAKVLFFKNKQSRPHNSPETPASPGEPASWREFVEFNRGLASLPQRPKDNDWSRRFGWIRGPLWVPRDSGIKEGHPPFPDGVHQINWGLAGLDLLNSSEAKERRFLFTRTNEDEPWLPPGPFDSRFEGHGGKFGRGGASGTW